MAATGFGAATKRRRVAAMSSNGEIRPVSTTPSGVSFDAAPVGVKGANKVLMQPSPITSADAGEVVPARADLPAPPHDRATSDAAALVTVVIPARNEEDFIADCLASIQAQSYRDLQIIVVDGDSTDRTAEIVASLAAVDPRIELLTNERRIIPASLNLGVAAARGPWLVRIDAHCTIPSDYVARAVGHLESGGWGGVGGRKDGVGRTEAGRAIAVAMGSHFGVGNSTYHHGDLVQVVDHIPFGCYPVALIRDLGGWDENLRVNQDYEFDQRVKKSGHDLLFDPDLRIDWHCRQSVPDLFSQYRRYGKGKIKVMRLHPGAVKARQVAPAALVAALATAGLISSRRPLTAAALVLPYAAFLAAGAFAERDKVESIGARAQIPAAFAAMHVGWGVGLWQGLGELIRDEVVGDRSTRSS